MGSISQEKRHVHCIYTVRIESNSVNTVQKRVHIYTAFFLCIMPQVINSLGGGHTHTNTYTDVTDKSDFKKPGTAQFKNKNILKNQTLLPAKPEPNMLKILPIIPSSTSQKIYPLFIFCSHILYALFFQVLTFKKNGQT